MTNSIMQGLLNAKPATKEARKIAKLKARKMFIVDFEMWHGYSLDNLKQKTFAFTLEEAHRRMKERAKAFGDFGDYKVIKITETNEYDICNSSKI